MPDITPDLVVEAYRRGLFPMADDAGDERLFWYDPPERGLLPIAGLHVPHRLRRTILKKNPYVVRVNADFSGVIRACAAPTALRPRTWINEKIIRLYTELHERGVAHSVEAWQGDRLVGGVYGLALGGAFFGESMFSTARDASKVALVHLAAHIWRQGFSLFDAQFVNDHIAQFGAFSVPRAEYLERLEAALALPCQFWPSSAGASGLSGVSVSGSVAPSGAFSSEKDVLSLSLAAAFLQSTTQTS